MSIQGVLVVVPLLAPSSYWEDTSFTHLSVFRCKDGPDAVYSELTAATAQPAVVPYYAVEADSGPSKALVGKTLGIIVNEATTYEITFTGTDPLTDDAIIAQVAAATSSAVVIFPTEDGKYALRTAATGNNTVLRVLESDAAPLLGLEYSGAYSYSYGKSAYIELVDDQDLYAFSDGHGETDAWYRYRYIDVDNNIVSEYSTTRQAKQFPGDNTCVGTLTLLDEANRPIEGAAVVFYIHDNASTHTPHRTRTWYTDADGTINVPLGRGLEVDMHVATTRLVRKITVPTDVSITTFDLLGPYGTGDVFDVVPAPELDTAVRGYLWQT